MAVEYRFQYLPTNAQAFSTVDAADESTAESTVGAGNFVSSYGFVNLGSTEPDSSTGIETFQNVSTYAATRGGDNYDFGS